MQVRSLLVEICHLLHQKGFVSATDGNISVRIDSNKILCTPSATPKEKVTETDLIVVDLSGKVIQGTKKASTELPMHLEIYKARDDVNAIIHAHPIYTTGFATAGIPLNECVFPEVILSIGAVPLCRYATPSTDEILESIKPFIKETNALMLQNHGAVTYGKDLWDAYYKMEKLEHTSQTLFVAKLLGGETVLSKQQVEKLKSLSQSTYGISQKNKIACEPLESFLKNKKSTQIEHVVKNVIEEIKRRTN